ncbi:MAG: HWE histidine kinase domain-containing protein, partial [Dongiaceae bacterium]
ALRENRAVRGVEAVVERPDGTRVPFIPYPTPLRDSSGAVIGAVNMLVDIAERKAAETALHEREARLALLVREIDHRAKNMLAIVQAVARRTKADSMPEFVETLMGRLHALARAHTLLTEARWAGADLQRLVKQELAAYGGSAERVTISGPRYAMEPGSAQPLAMALHELATNAAKYGALSVPGGRLAVDWLWASDGRLLIRWTETGGPPVRQPSRRGFGFELIDALSEQLGGTTGFDWRPEGLVCEISLAAATPEPAREAAE